MNQIVCLTLGEFFLIFFVMSIFGSFVNQSVLIIIRALRGKSI